MKTKLMLAAAVAAIACIVAGMLLKRAPDEIKSAPEQVVAAQPHPEPPAVAPAVEPVEKAAPAPEIKTEIAAAPEKISAAVPAQKPAQQNNSAAPKEPLHDPAARAALALVGVDANAEAYWLAAIFDSSLPDNEREDLIEDLNEDGLSDPKHPGPQDLPLILNRLAIIEELAPQADAFMLEHLGEAYKDLNNLLAGKPVQ